MNSFGHAVVCPTCSRSFASLKAISLHFRACGTPDPATLFWLKVDKGEGCWIFSGAKLPKEIGGYGWATYCGKVMGAHRIAWLLTNGPIPEGLHVLHKCDNGPCCNPAHLFLGTHLDNMADMYSKGRNTRGAKARAKLTEEQAKLILSRKPETVRGSGALPYELAAQHGVGVGVIWCIWRGQTWRHLQEKETTV